MTKKDKIIKRFFDLLVSTIGLLFFGWLIILTAIIAKFDTKLSGIFKQNRIGQNGKIFKIYKIRSMKKVKGLTTTVSTSKDKRITRIGGFFRKYKLDELPQLINVFIGDMSLVGPRPDVKGYADMLKGENRIILTIKPGITGPASLYFRDEEAILARQSDPEIYNKNIIWPKKIEINKLYINNYSLLKDIQYIFKTIK